MDTPSRTHVSAAEAAELAHVSRMSIHRAVQAGELPALRIGGARIVLELAHVLDWIDGRKRDQVRRSRMRRAA